MSKAASQTFVSTFDTGHPGVTTSINDANLHEHHLVMGKTLDGMGGLYGDLASRTKQSNATGLLANLLRRI